MTAQPIPLGTDRELHLTLGPTRDVLVLREYSSSPVDPAFLIPRGRGIVVPVDRILQLQATLELLAREAAV